MKKLLVFLVFLITFIGCTEINNNIDNTENKDNIDNIFDQIDLDELKKYVSESAYHVAKYVKTNKIRVDVPDTLNVFLEWLKSEEYVKEVEYNETYDVISISFTDGTDYRIVNVFETGEEVKSVSPVLLAAKESSDESFTFDVSSVANEVIQENLNILYINAMPNEGILPDDEVLTLDPPINIKIKEIKAMDEWLGLDGNEKYGSVYISHTHGLGGGDFVFSDMVATEFLWNVMINNRGKFYDGRVLPLGDILNSNIHDHPAFVYANYCWSAEASTNNFPGTIVAINAKSEADKGVENSKRYFAHLFHGLTHRGAFETLDRIYTFDGITAETFEYGDDNVRYFSISTADPIMTDENITIQGKINGFNSLKFNECDFKLFYRKGSSHIESPTETGVESIMIKNIHDDGSIIMDITELIESGVDYTFRLGFVYKNNTYLGESKTFNFIQNEQPGTWVDLGLSVLWSDRNVGARSPEGYGKYYAWAEVDDKNEYSLKSYKYYNSYKQTYTKFESEICGTKYDVAHCKWGGGARLPRVEDIDELRTKCTRKEGAYNGVLGTYVIGPNGNSIFLPKAGYRFESEYRDVDEIGYFWSGRCLSNYSMQAVNMYDNGLNDFLGCHLGMSVRPVKDK